MRKLLIIGAGGHGAVIANIAQEMGEFEKIAFLDDGEKTECLGFPVIAKSNAVKHYANEYEFFVAIGNCATRKKVTEDIQSLGGKLATLIHPQAVIAKGVVIGEGTVVMAGTVIEPRTRVGKGCIVNTSSSLNHDVTLGEFVHVAVGAHVAGTVRIGDLCWVGIGATVKNNVDICAEAFIGAGAVVVKDITKKGTYVGVPARRIEKK